MYHRLGKVRKKSIAPGHYVGAKQFENHLRLLRLLKKTPISLAQLKAGFDGETLPEKPVVITFDDGYKSFYEIGLPILRKYDCPATVFLVSEYVGSNNQWDLKIGDVEEALMSREEVSTAAGYQIEFGSHTVHHANLGKVSLAEAEQELAESFENLNSWLPKPAQFFCYPYGGQTPEVRQLVRKAGYVGATTVERGINTAKTDPFGWGRINVRATTSAFGLWRKFAKTRNAL